MGKLSTNQLASWFYTAPTDEVAVRRGDPLGLQSVAERVAEALAPGLSNRTMDARWISILCWCLREGQSAWKAHGNGRDPDGQAAIGKHLYPWVRPLELLWVARAAEVGANEGRGRQLPGIRPIREWLSRERRPDQFAFAASSYEQYRFTGSYGGYRAALRALQGMTANGGGWLPSDRGQNLAEIVAKHVRSPTTYPPRRGPATSPERHWIDSVSWKTSSQHFIPTLLEQPQRLEGDERSILRAALFVGEANGAGANHTLRRRKVAEAAARSAATTRPELMANLAAALKDERDLEWLPHLEAFSELADAGTDAMNACWRAVSMAPDRVLKAGEVAVTSDSRAALRDLVRASRRWKLRGSNAWSDRAGKLSESILSRGTDPGAILSGLIQFHTAYGGGLKWVILDGEMVRPVARLRDGDASTYQYRLPALTRLARQCGVTSAIPALLRDDIEAAPAEAAGVPS